MSRLTISYKAIGDRYWSLYGYHGRTLVRVRELVELYPTVSFKVEPVGGPAEFVYHPGRQAL